jgi:hypothetical protein
MLGLHLEKKSNSPTLIDDEKPKYRRAMSPVKKSYMSIMERVMQCREHLTSNENSLFIGSIDSDFEGDERRGGQGKK